VQLDIEEGEAMSEIILCNYCNLKKIRADARRYGNHVVLRQATGKLKGVNTYVVPDAYDLTHLTEGSEAHKKYFRAWFMSVPDHCVC
jgi:hypothetical protein